MSIPTSEISEQLCLENAFHTTVLQTSLKHFVHQFELAGCGLFQMNYGQPAPQPLDYWSESRIDDLLPHLIGAIASQFPEGVSDWQQISMTSPAEAVWIGSLNTSTPYHLYGCLCASQAETRYYLLCWHDAPLSEHQRYGVSLYAQTVQPQLSFRGTATHSPSATAKFPPKPVSLDLQTLHDILQRTRHQLRTPLALVLLYADLLKTTTTDQQAQDWLATLRSTTEEMHVSLDYLTDSTDLLQAASGNVDVCQLVEQCIQEMHPWIEQKQLTVVYNPQPLWLWVNGWKIKQVLQNLLSNAIAFSPPHGHIICEWQVFHAEVLIKISDSGPGLSAEDLRSIGTPFYSRRPGGTGLGLSIAKQMILEHQGSLWADNLPTGGAQFCITLPRRSRNMLG